MDTSKILTELRTEQARLTRAIAAIEAIDGNAVSKPLTQKAPSKATAPTTKRATKKKRMISPEARARMAEAQRKRWAGHNKAAKSPAAKKSAKEASKV